MSSIHKPPCNALAHKVSACDSQICSHKIYRLMPWVDLGGRGIRPHELILSLFLNKKTPFPREIMVIKNKQFNINIVVSLDHGDGEGVGLVYTLAHVSDFTRILVK